MAKNTTKKDETPLNETPLNLTQKLCQVMATVDRIPKTGRNDYHGYSYAEEAVIVEAIRKELASRNVMLYPSLQQTGAITVEGGITTVMMTYTFVDGDSGETMESAWAGQGQDSGDKGLYKAYTGSNKYYLMKTFLLPTGDEQGADDPENPAFAKAPPAPFAKTPTPVVVEVPDTDTDTDERVYVQQINEKSGESNGKPWQRFEITFSDGQTPSTFDTELALRAEDAQTRGAAVVYTTRSKGKYLNLDTLEISGGA